MLRPPYAREGNGSVAANASALAPARVAVNVMPRPATRSQPDEPPKRGWARASVARLEARSKLWPFALLPLLQWGIAFVAVGRVRCVATYDTAYYYVLARNVALGRGLTDTVLWQFLGAPDTAARPAGSYWEIGWPLVLGALMRIFGSSQRASILICAGLSALVPLAAALCTWLSVKRRAAAWLSGLLLCLQARLLATSVTPDMILWYQLTCLLGMAAFLWIRERPVPRGHLVAAGAVLALPMHVRGEGFVVSAAALALLLFGGGRPSRESVRRALWVALGVALLSVPLTLRNVVVFGRLTPESRTLRLWMTRYDDLYYFRSEPSRAGFWAQGWARLFSVRQRALAAHLGALTTQIPWPLLPLSAVGVLARVRARRTWILPVFFALSLLVPCLVVPLIASADRFVMNVLPVLCVASTLGIFTLRDLLARRVRSRLLGAALVGVASWASVAVFRKDVTVQTYLDRLDVYRDTPAFLTDTRQLAPLRMAPTDVVLTDDPWRVAAVLDVTTVINPFDGPTAIEAAFDRYRPRFVLASNPALRRLTAARVRELKLVATMRDGAWYELQEGVKRADGTRVDAAP
jgi:4-amino-4-deoxy-L-arabinose transferase-like glycosyltransferase